MSNKRIICPYCSKSFLRTEALYQCTNNAKKNGQDVCPMVIDAELNNHWGETNVPSRLVFKSKSSVFGLFSGEAKPAKCPQCGQPTQRLVCPHCHNSLPTQMVEDGSEIISIVGDRSSGKTVYFLSLIHELKKYGYKIGVFEVNPMDLSYDEKTRTSVVYESMSGKLFDPKYPALPNQTHVSRPAPLIFKLSSKGPNSKSVKSIYLVFYDTAGEIFRDANKIDDIARYLKDSSGVIFLIDPFTMDGLQDTLIDGGVIEKDNESSVRTDPTRIFDRLTQFTNNEKLKDKPLALTYSKIDAVITALHNCPQDYEIPGIDLSLNSSFIKTGIFNLDEIERIHEGIKTVSEQKWDVGNLWSQASNSYSDNNVRMFAVSALGNNPDKAGNLERVRPYRVMDPLVWILYKIGFDIPTE